MSPVAQDVLQLCAFRIAGRRFGVDIRRVREVCPALPLTPVPHAPKQVQGYVNVRGQIELVLDPRGCFGWASESDDHAGRIVLFKTEGDEPFGIRVDAMDDVVTVPAARLRDRRQPESGRSEEAGKKDSPDIDRQIDRQIDRRMASVALGVCRLPEGLLVVLDPRAMLAACTEASSQHAAARAETVLSHAEAATAARR